MIDISTAPAASSQGFLEGKIADTIRSFANLPDGWHYGTGTGAVHAAVDAALNVNSLLVDYGARNIEVFPDVDGGILVSGYRDRYTLEILCFPDGRMDLVYEVDDEIVNERSSISITEIEEFLGGSEWFLPKLFAHCTQSISAKKGGASLVWLSSPHPEMGEYQYSRQNAPFTLVDANVAISIVSTVASLDIPMFSGGSVLISSQKIAGLLVSRLRQATPATGISMDWKIIDAGTW